MNCLDCAIKDKKIAELRDVIKDQAMTAIRYRIELEELSEHPESEGSKQIREKYIRKIEARRSNLKENLNDNHLKNKTMINQTTIDKMLHFLNECKNRIDKPRFSARQTISECKVSTSSFCHAIKLGYFTKKYFPSGVRYFCAYEQFEPHHARKLVEINNNKQRQSYEKNKEREIQNQFFKIEKSNIGGVEIFAKTEQMKSKIPPDINDVRQYCLLRKNNVNPEQWYAHYESVGWKVGKNKMIDWQGAIRTWEHRSNTVFVNKKISDFSDAEFHAEAQRRKYPSKSLSDYSMDELLNEMKRRGVTGNIGFTF